MVKRREVASKETATEKSDLEQKVDEFASHADGGEAVAPLSADERPNAPRTYSSTRFPYNKYEYDLVAQAAEKCMRSNLSFIRMAMIAEAKRILDIDT
jgi:hypothetical protein